MISWNSGEVGANENRIGPTLNWILPDADATQMTLRLKTESGKDSEYVLSYRARQAKKISRQLNV